VSSPSERRAKTLDLAPSVKRLDFWKSGAVFLRGYDNWHLFCYYNSSETFTMKHMRIDHALL